MQTEGTYAAVGVTHRYSPQAPLVLDRVTLAVNRGSIHGILGHNGAGKSTLLGVLAGRIRPTHGHLEDGGSRVNYHAPRDALQKGVVTVYQELSVVPSLTVAENILVGRLDRGTCRRSSSRRDLLVDEALARAGIEPHYRDRLVGQLKFGERQQVEIARALSRRSRYLLLDEPTAGLDEAEVERLFGVLRRMAEADHPVGILIVNHHVDQVFDLSDSYTVIRDGQVVLTGERGSRPRGEVVAAIVGEDVEGAKDLSQAASPVGARRPARKEQPSLQPPKPGSTAPLEITDLDAPGVRCQHLSVPQGEVHGLYGLEGAGQDALVAVLSGE